MEEIETFITRPNSARKDGFIVLAKTGERINPYAVYWKSKKFGIKQQFQSFPNAESAYDRFYRLVGMEVIIENKRAKLNQELPLP